MRTLLRSTFVAAPDDNRDLLLRNVNALEESGLGFDVDEDEALWNYIKGFVNQYHHPPDVSTLRSHFTFAGETAVVDRLEAVANGKARSQGDFLTSLNEKIEERRTRKVTDILRDAARILDSGIEVKEGKQEKLLRGPVAAVRYVMEQAPDIVAPTGGQRLSGNVTADGVPFSEEYERTETNPLAGIGQMSGIRQMDDALRGAKRGELWTHAAFTGGLKSTLMLNWCYSQAVYYRHSSVIFSLEMPYTQVRRILYAMHSAHHKFDGIRQALGLGKSLSYSRIRDGELDMLSPEQVARLDPEAVANLVQTSSGRFMNPNRPEKQFLMDYVVPDLNDPANEYGNIHIEVADPDKSDFTVTDMRNRAEVIYSRDPTVALVFADHAGLMAPRHHHSSTTERLNEVIRDLKRFSMSFNRGAGIATVALFQISREGFKAAEKGGGRYNLTHLSYANECSVAGTFVRSSRGVVPIEQVVVGDKVWSRSGWKPVLDTFDQGVRPVWKVVTDRGSELCATGNHRVRTLSDEGFAWTEVQHLSEGSWVVSTTGDYPEPAKAPVLPPLTVGSCEKGSGEQGTPLTTPDVVTENLAYLLGAWHGDGRVHPQGVAFTGNRKETSVRERIRQAFLSEFGHPLSVQESPSRPGSFDLTKWSQPLKRWFEQVAGVRGKEVPPVVLAAPRTHVLAFLQGLFDTDGWVNNQGVVGLKMKSENLLRQVQHLLTMLGQDTTLTMTPTTLKATGLTYEGWTLRIRGQASRRAFMQGVGFTEPWKMERLQGVVDNTPSLDKRVYPVARAFLGLCAAYTPHSLCSTGVLKRAHFNTIASASRTGLVPHGAVMYLLDFLSTEGVVDERMGFLREVLRLQVMRVLRVAPTGTSEQVYDIEVDGDHEYQTGPLLSHNCERSSDIVTAGWVDDNLRQQSLLKLQCLKSRDDQPFEDFYAGVLWPCRRIFSTNAVSVEQSRKVGEDVDKMLAG